MTIRAERSARWLDVVVHDDGRGLPDGFSLEKSDRLGLQIVRTLVSAELDGSLGMHDVADRRDRCGVAGADRQTRAPSQYCGQEKWRANAGINPNCSHSYGPGVSPGPSAENAGRG